MMKINAKILLITVIAMLVLLPTISFATDAGEQTDIYSGFYSRDGNDDRAARVSGNSIYIKFYPDQWVIMLYVPYPYATTLENKVLHDAFRTVSKRVKSKSYIRGKFGALDRQVIAHIEKYEMPENNKAVFECDGTAPCRVKFSNGSMEMRKAGMLNDHIIKFNRIDE